MFKKALASLATTICCLGNPSVAAPTSCWVAAQGDTGNIPSQMCDISTRVNANGHTVVDLVTVGDGGAISIVLWLDSDGTPSYAEVFHNYRRTLWAYEVDKDGDIHLYHRGSHQSIWFSLPETRTEAYVLS